MLFFIHLQQKNLILQQINCYFVCLIVNNFIYDTSLQKKERFFMKNQDNINKSEQK